MIDRKVPETENGQKKQQGEVTKENTSRRAYAVSRQNNKLDLVVYVAMTVVSLIVLVVLLANLFRGGSTAKSEAQPTIAPAVIGSSSSPTASTGVEAVAQATQTTTPAASTYPPMTSTSVPAISQSMPMVMGATPSEGTSAAAGLLQQVAKAEAALTSGELEATIQYSEGNTSSTTVQFDLGDQNHVPRLYSIAKYQHTSETQTVEEITVGNQSWQRQSGGAWRVAPETEGVWGRVQAFLPHANLISNAESKRLGDVEVLQWYDASRDADVTLQVDPTTGVLKELRQLTRTTGLTLTVTYRGWNSPVQIQAPH